MPVSETEKHGVSTSGCRYNDKVENIPIKKRRFLLRSPSPPPVKTSPCAEETADHTEGRGVSEKLVPSGVILSQTVDDNDCLDIKNSVKPDLKLSEGEDFSGISILAAAACSSSLGRDCGYAQDVLGVDESSGLERDREASANTEAHTSSKGFSKEDVNSSEMSSGATSSCKSTEPVGELASISTTVNSSQEVATIGKVVEEAIFSKDVSCTKELARNPRLSSRDERLHWDLNVVMDAWEQPFDDLNAQDAVSHDLSEDPCKGNHNDIAQTGEHDALDNLGTVYSLQHCLLPEEPRALISQSNENHDMNASLNFKQTPVVNDKSLSSSSNSKFDVINYKVEITKGGRYEETVNPTDGLVVAVPDGMMHVLASCTMIESEGAPLKILNLNDERSGNHSVVEDFKSNTGVPSCDLQNLENTGASDATLGVVSANTHISLCVSSISDTLIEQEPNIGVSKALETPKMLHREGNDLVEDVDLKMVEAQEHTEFAISNDNSLSDSEALNSMPKRYAVGDLHEGYDSQYEDGELRESSVRAWEKYDREAENVDNVSKYKEPYSANPSDYHALDSGQVVDRKSGSLEVGRPVSFDDCNVDYDVYRGAADAAGNDRGHDEGNQLKLSHVGEKTEQSLGKEKRSKSFSDVATLGADDNGGKDKISSHLIDRCLDSRGTETRTESRAFRVLQSQVEGPVGREDISRDEQVKKSDNRFDSGSMRSFERLRYSFHNQVRGRQGASWDGSSDGRRGFRRHYSPIIRGNRKLNGNAVVDRDDLGCIDSPDDALYSQQLNRSSAEVESCVGFNSRFNADRKFSPDRGGGFGRGRPFRYGPFGESRGGRGRYNEPSPDETFHYSLKYRRPLSRRERSLSPFGVGEQSNIHHSRRKSPSHSRSRSPIIWNSPRRRLGAGSCGGGNTFLRHRSRSPNFRSEARIPRPRSPHHQPDVGVDHAGGFRTISRNHGSPPRRWTSSRKDEMGKFREIGYKQRTLPLDRSPGRIHLKSSRGNDVGSPRSLKPDGFYRMSDRIPNDAGRGVRYEENYEDRRKQYNPFRPTRRNYDDDVNDSFSMPNSFRDRGASNFQDRGLRSIDNRLSDLPRKFRGENHSFFCERDGKFNNNSKQFGLDGMNSSHNLKSDEQYRPNYAGRFSDISGTSRGSRYENYEDRRKRYSETNIMRRSDKEDTEKRLNDNENFEDTCGRDTRGFDGRIGSFLTRFREDEEPLMSGQEEKLTVNTQPVVQNAGENDVTK